MKRLAQLSLVLATTGLIGHTADAEIPKAAANHHMHVQGPTLLRCFETLRKVMPEAFTPAFEKLETLHTPGEARRDLDNAGVRRGTLLSGAYLCASPAANPKMLDVSSLVRAENQFNVDAARASHGRFVAFIGINPFDPSALPEIDYWARHGGAAGIKLHLGGSFFDPLNPQQWHQLKQVFAAAARYRMAITIHLRGLHGFDEVAAKRFVTEVLPAANGTIVQIAHAGGFGGIDEQLLRNLAIYEDAIARGAPGTQSLYFDLALTVDKPDPDKALCTRFAAMMRKIGLNRWLIGSDWPLIWTTAQHDAILEGNVPLTEAEWTQVARNLGPYFSNTNAGP